MSNVENYPVFQETLQLPSSRLVCNSWAFLEALYRAGSRWQVGFDGADWWSRRVVHMVMIFHHLFSSTTGSSPIG
jgi:hypothetical protein